MLDDRGSGAPLYRQIYDSIRRSILAGEVEPGTRLPASRTLAEQLSVSRLTVVNAYDQLLAEGYLEGRQGSGTYVASELPDDLLSVNEKAAARIEPTASSIRLSKFGERLAALEANSLRTRTISALRPFQHGLPAIDEFPFDIWSKIALRVHRDPPRSILAYGDPQGYEPLRQAIASHLRSSRGVSCDADQVVITPALNRRSTFARASFSPKATLP